MTSPALEHDAPDGAAPQATPPRARGRAAVAPDEGLWEAFLEDWKRSSFWQIAREVYFRFDRRALGITRFLLGFFLLMDLFHRATVWNDMYSSKGVLPTHLNLQRPMAFGAWSFFNAFETPGELAALWLVMFVTYMCLFVGFKTKAAQVLSMIFVVSMNGRVLLIENGGYVVHNLLLLWTMFLPLGDRFSVDSMLESMKRRREATDAELNDRTGLLPPEKFQPHYSILGPVLFVQISAIYFFNYLHKTGPAWKNGTAVHFVIYVDRMVTPGVALVRDHIPNWAIQFMTRSTVGMEVSFAFILFSPLAYVWCRRIAIFMMNTLHLAFGAAMVLGPFAWACCMFSTLLFSTDDVELAKRTMLRRHRARTIVFDRRSGAALFVCRILKRLDGFELLTFRAADGVKAGLRVETRAGRDVPGTLGLSDLVSALPLGPAVAWLFRVPVGKQLASALLGYVETHDASAFFGLRVPAHGVVAPDASPVRRNVRRFGFAGLRELLIALMFAGAVNRAAVELWVINRRWHVSEPLSPLSLKLRFLQGWFMFSPNPVMDDGTVVVDALTVDGRHIDPFSGEPPNYDLLNVKSYGYSQIWCDYLNRIHLPANTAYREAMREYMRRYHERTGNPNDEIVSGEVSWIQDMNPKWNETKSWKYEQIKLFTFDKNSVKAASASNSTTTTTGATGANGVTSPTPLARPPVPLRAPQ